MNYWTELMGTDESAATYMDSYGQGPGCETRLIVGSFINDGESVLDVGCGPGWNFDHFNQYGPKVRAYRGIDYSDRFVRVAKERFLRNHPSSKTTGKFRLGDCRDLKEPDDSWDVVILQDVLEHTNGYERPLSEALRVAKKRIIVSFWRGQMRDDFANDTGVSKVRDDGNDGFCGEYSKIEWEKYLDSLDLHWLETQCSPEANRWNRFYIIDLEIKHG